MDSIGNTEASYSGYGVRREVRLQGPYWVSFYQKGLLSLTDSSSTHTFSKHSIRQTYCFQWHHFWALGAVNGYHSTLTPQSRNSEQVFCRLNYFLEVILGPEVHETRQSPSVSVLWPAMGLSSKARVSLPTATSSPSKLPTALSESCTQLCLVYRLCMEWPHYGFIVTSRCFYQHILITHSSESHYDMFIHVYNVCWSYSSLSLTLVPSRSNSSSFSCQVVPLHLLCLSFP